MLDIRGASIQEAVEHFRKVSETMPAGPEKGIALLSQMSCHESLNQHSEAKRCRDAALAMPNILWSFTNNSAAWTPMSANGRRRSGTTIKLAPKDKKK